MGESACTVDRFISAVGLVIASGLYQKRAVIQWIKESAPWA